MKTLRARGGFTLIELLLVIGIIAILAAIVIVAINPTRQLAQARNTQRQSDITQIINAVYQYAIDVGSLPPSITTDSTEICNNSFNTAATCTGLIDLSTLTPNYLVKIPKDPQKTVSDSDTDYAINKDVSNRIVVKAVKLEPPLTETLTVTR